MLEKVTLIKTPDHMVTGLTFMSFTVSSTLGKKLPLLYVKVNGSTCLFKVPQMKVYNMVLFCIGNTKSGGVTYALNIANVTFHSIW